MGYRKSTLQEAEALASRAVSLTGGAYAPVRDAREMTGSVSAWLFTAYGVVVSAYTIGFDQWRSGTIALLAASVAGAALSLILLWVKVPGRAFLIVYWAEVAVVLTGAAVLDQPAMNVFLLAPILFMTYFYWRDRVVVASHLSLLALVAAIPFTGAADRSETASMFVTLPILLLIGIVVGVLADRLGAVREIERDRFKATIEALCTALTARDGYTGEHSQETLALVAKVCDRLRLGSSETAYVSDVALLHNIGKIGIPNDILNAPGRLDDEQWMVMKTHPEIGERIVARVPGLEGVAKAIRHEHERWDGTGYPDGLKEHEIPLASRIVLACDAFHAMTSDRPYRGSIGVVEARAELRRNSATQFDPTVVQALLSVTEAHQQAADEGRTLGAVGRLARASA